MYLTAKAKLFKKCLLALAIAPHPYSLQSDPEGLKTRTA